MTGWQKWGPQPWGAVYVSRPAACVQRVLDTEPGFSQELGGRQRLPREHPHLRVGQGPWQLRVATRLPSTRAHEGVVEGEVPAVLRVPAN